MEAKFIKIQEQISFSAGNNPPTDAMIAALNAADEPR